VKSRESEFRAGRRTSSWESCTKLLGQLYARPSKIIPRPSYVFRTLVRLGPEEDLVHACDLDTYRDNAIVLMPRLKRAKALNENRATVDYDQTKRPPVENTQPDSRQGFKSPC